MYVDPEKRRSERQLLDDQEVFTHDESRGGVREARSGTVAVEMGDESDDDDFLEDVLDRYAAK